MSSGLRPINQPFNCGPQFPLIWSVDRYGAAATVPCFDGYAERMAMVVWPNVPFVIWVSFSDILNRWRHAALLL
jgi:hypothetical protein